MKPHEYESVCYRTEQRDESVVLYNRESGFTGVSLGCTREGDTVQVQLENGELDTWERTRCVVVS